MSTLKERAARWLKGYKNGLVDEAILPIEDRAAIISEYLHGSAADTQVDSQAYELEKQVQELKFQLDAVGKRAIRLEGENSALRFSVRCNGVSGAEV